MEVRVLLFAAFREAVGSPQLRVDVPEGITVCDLFHRLEQDYPRLEALRAYTTFAVNREVVDATWAVHAGDEIAFLQPASGG